MYKTEQLSYHLVLCSLDKDYLEKCYLGCLTVEFLCYNLYVLYRFENIFWFIIKSGGNCTFLHISIIQ